ncbi:MAG: hypothetical protein ACE5FA_00340 [Dehalococcoidia bacterium]
MGQHDRVHVVLKNGDELGGTTTDTEAAKFWLAGAASGASIGVDQDSTAEDPVQFRISTTTWTQALAAQGATTATQWCGFNAGNVGTAITVLQFRFGSSGNRIYEQPLAANGGAFNHNFIGGKPKTANNEAIQVRLLTGDAGGDVRGSIIFQKR